ncbi:MAG: FAD-dependent oxidoreductase [Chitinophaga sp.]|uniref:FAD-dependent monooxygenase n=1 Tax=Chitinophaga sp. TaxID=1869181 RepID=UPI001B109C61|nr:FAD-dependent monooxygenase [Chitinophaga sp.]MBO9732674.1 FAD-dependent oxidoreductase [Chitinophaga sp.]
MSNPFVPDVIIAGAGPVGLFLAAELAQANCSVLILEKAADPVSPLKQLPFGMRGLSAPSIEALYRRGLLDELEIHKRTKYPHSHSVRTAQAPPATGPGGHFAGITFHQQQVDTSQWKYRLPESTPANLMSGMMELETVLTRRAVALGVDIRRGITVTDIRQTADGVTVQAGDQSFNAKWLVGCDGGRSTVRKKGGFEFAGTEPTFTGYSVGLDIADVEKLRPGRNVTETGMYLLSQPNYLILQDFDGGAFHKAAQPITREHVQALLRRISNTDVTITAVHVATTWTDRSRQATAYRNGRILLAGDAAHIHSPLGGQGLNLGLGDAMNLGWKLAATIHHQAPEGLLDSYYTERYPVGEKVLDWSRAQIAIMHPDPHARALYAIIRDLMHTRDGVTYMAGRIWGITTHYTMDGNHPLAGYSVPNFTFEDGTDIGEHLREGRAILLDFEVNVSLEKLTAAYAHQVKYMAGNVKNRLGLSVVLIRPDGIVAWAADGTPDMEELQRTMDRWFVREAALINANEE